MKKETFDVFGMTCASCQAAVDRSVRKLDGVDAVDVSLISQSMKVEYDPEKTTPEQIAQAVDHAGYKAVSQEKTLNEAASASAADLWESRRERMAKETDQKKKTLIVSLVLLAVLLCFSMLPMLGIFTSLMSMEWMMVDGIIQLVLSMLILFFQRDFFTHGFRALFKGNPNMDSLVAIGSAVSFGYGLYGLLMMARGYGLMDHHMIHASMDALYFESAAMIVTLVSLGKYLEARSKSKTGDALAKLVKMSPKTALVARGDTFIEIAADQVITGDLVKIVPGASIPVDGIVASGSGTVDQSALTGESIPVDKKPGDPVMSATTNLNGSFVFEATKVGADTTLAQIITLVDDAGNSKAPIARLADKVSGIFVPAVLIIAAVTFIGWLIAGQSLAFALNCAISVLVISCPCALGLATPLAIMVSTGKAAQNGILVKSAAALETLAKINTVVLDKTGTITKGKPEVSSIVLIDPSLDEQQFMRLAAAAESGSEHPLAKAVLLKASQDGLQIPAAQDFTAFGGRGLQAAVEGKKIIAGNLAFMEEENIPLCQSVRQEADRLARQGGTPLFFAVDGQIAGIISVADQIRETSRQAIRQLHRQGIEVIMLTGDNRQTAQAIASGLDLSEVISDVLPADKESVVRSLQEKGRRVAMVGDGINDAPALMRADVGIAIGAGTDIAIDAADIVLMKDNLLDVVTAIDLSKATIRNIKENLFWAFFYNCLGIPVAMGLFYPVSGWLLNPMIGAAAMSFSSITVCLNALRLRLFKPAKVSEQAEKSEQNLRPAALSVIRLDQPQGEVHPASQAAEVSEHASAAEKISEDMKQAALFAVEGMSCAHCQTHVKEAVESLDGTENVQVSLEPAYAYVQSNVIYTPEDYGKVIEEAGYETLPADQKLEIALLKESRPENLPELEEMLLNVQKNQASWVFYDPKTGVLSLYGAQLPRKETIEREIGMLQKEKTADENKNQDTLKSEGEDTMKLNIEGMSCAHCAARVEKALKSVDGVENATVDLANKQAEVSGSDLDAVKLAKAVTEAGYAVTSFE